MREDAQLEHSRMPTISGPSVPAEVYAEVARSIVDKLSTANNFPLMASIPPSYAQRALLLRQLATVVPTRLTWTLYINELETIAAMTGIELGGRANALVHVLEIMHGQQKQTTVEKLKNRLASAVGL